jgi:hypothetical protein
MLLKRSLLVFFVFGGALACSEKPKVDLTAEPQSSAGSLAKPVEASSAESIKVDRSPIPVKDASGKLALSATTFLDELLEERLAFFAGERVLRLHPLRNRMVVTYAGYVAVLQDHRLEPAQHIAPQEAYEFTSVVGTWPDSVVAEVQFDSGKSITFTRQAPIKETRYYRWGGDWVPLSGPAIVKAAAWRDGWLLSFADLRRSAFPSNDNRSTEEGATTVPKQAAPRDSERCKEALAEVTGDELDALPSGEAFVVGKRCGEGGYALERWAAGQTESTIDDLPDAPSNAKRAFLSAGAPDRAHVVLSTGDRVYAARWDGQALRKIELKDEGDVRSIRTTADGALFFVLQPKSAGAKKTKAELVRVLPSGEVSRSPAFALSPSVNVWAADAQTAYVASFSSILSTKPGLVFTKGKTEEPTPSPSPSPPPSASALPAFTDACSTPLVFLYDVSTKSPPGYDFPGTRKALSTFSGAPDIGLLEFVHAGQRKLGVRIPSAEVGRKVIAHVVANMKDERPELVCFAPIEGVRAIALH